MPTRSLICISALVIAVTCAVASISTSPADARVKVINPPDAPASLSHVTIQNDDGRQISFVHYDLQNKGQNTLKGVFLKLVFFDQLGRPTGGEIFLEHVDLKSHHRAQFHSALSHYADTDIGTVGITISAANTDRDHWKDQTPTQQIVKQMKD